MLQTRRVCLAVNTMATLSDLSHSEPRDTKDSKKYWEKKIATLQAQLLEFPVKKSVAYEEYNQIVRYFFWKRLCLKLLYLMF